MLPKLVVDRAADPSFGAGHVATDHRRLWAFLRYARFVPVVMGLVMLGGVIGLYFQPPGLKKLFAITGLTPGGGTSSPIAVPVSKAPPKPSAQPRQVVGLGKLIPSGDVTTVAPPFGAGDARIAALNVTEGQTVAKDAILATLDNEQPLKAALESARAAANAREAALAQTRATVQSSRDEARAALDRARVTLANAQREYERADALYKRGVSTAVTADQRRSTRDEATREVERLQATLSRWENADSDKQPDVIVAARNLDAAKADVARAERDLEKAYVRAPRAGTVLTIYVRAGEKPGTKGLMTLGDIDHMTAEVEIYQTQIGLLSVGAPVKLTAEALSRPLEGTVSKIGLEVQRQTLVDPSPAANTDARVIKVDVDLDPPSAALARGYTNLQVTARITVKDAP